MSEQIIKIENVDIICKNKDGEFKLSNINLDVLSGKITGLFGGNGSGKSTILRAIRGSINLDRGTIFYCNTDIATLASETRLSKSALCSQAEDKHPYQVGWTCKDVVEGGILSRESKYAKVKLDIAVTELFEALNATHLLKKKHRQLSGGQLKLVSIMEALISVHTGVKLFLFDEPLNNLDSNFAVLVSNYLTRMIKKFPDIAIVIVTHCRMFPVVDNAYELKDGKLTLIHDYEYKTCFGEVDCEGCYKIQ